jgi:hypothetical protein
MFEWLQTCQALSIKIDFSTNSCLNKYIVYIRQEVKSPHQWRTLLELSAWQRSMPQLNWPWSRSTLRRGSQVTTGIINRPAPKTHLIACYLGHFNFSALYTFFFVRIVFIIIIIIIIIISLFFKVIESAIFS